MKIRILYAMMADDDSVLNERHDYVDIIAPDGFWSDYCKEQAYCQGVVNSAVQRVRYSDKTYKPVAQYWFRLYFE